jgi:hypothetical protein
MLKYVEYRSTSQLYVNWLTLTTTSWLSTTTCRLRPEMRLAPPYPRLPPASLVRTVWLSMIAVCGDRARPSRAGAPAQGVVDPPPQAAVPPSRELIIHAAPGRELVRQQTPGHASTQHVEHGIQNNPSVMLAWTAAVGGGLQKRRQDPPLGVAHIGAEGLCRHALQGEHRPIIQTPFKN